MTLSRSLASLLFGLALICPVCRRGRMFRSLFVMRERCPQCGVVFEKNAGEVTGGMAINMVLTSILGVVAVVYGVFFSGLDINVVIAAIVVFTVGFGLLFHRHARGLWVGFLHVTGAVAER
jgi:uncharacterized protein (DUF983 family)